MMNGIMNLVHEGEFPDGLVCIDCNKEIEVGSAYIPRPDGVMADGSLIEELVCLDCVFGVNK